MISTKKERKGKVQNFGFIINSMIAPQKTFQKDEC